MEYQSVNPANGDVLRSFDQHTDEQMLSALATAEKTYRSIWSTMASALNVGLTADELYEIIIHTVVFAGFPTAINALSVLDDFLSQHHGGQKNS